MGANDITLFSPQANPNNVKLGQTAGASGAMVGSSAWTSVWSGSVTGKGALVGSQAWASAWSGAVTGKGALVGVQAWTSVWSDSVTGKGALVGSQAWASAWSGAVTGKGAVAGGSTWVSAWDGTLAGSGDVVGIDAWVSTWSATLTSIFTPSAPPSYGGGGGSVGYILWEPLAAKGKKKRRDPKGPLEDLPTIGNLALRRAEQAAREGRAIPLGSVPENDNQAPYREAGGDLDNLIALEALLSTRTTRPLERFAGRVPMYRPVAELEAGALLVAGFALGLLLL